MFDSDDGYSYGDLGYTQVELDRFRDLLMEYLDSGQLQFDIADYKDSDIHVYCHKCFVTTTYASYAEAYFDIIDGYCSNCS